MHNCVKFDQINEHTGITNSVLMLFCEIAACSIDC